MLFSLSCSFLFLFVFVVVILVVVLLFVLSVRVVYISLNTLWKYCSRNLFPCLVRLTYSNTITLFWRIKANRTFEHLDYCVYLIIPNVTRISITSSCSVVLFFLKTQRLCARANKETASIKCSRMAESQIRERNETNIVADGYRLRPAFLIWLSAWTWQWKTAILL